MLEDVGEQSDGMLEKSILVVAHPDDEALWYSSILPRLDSIVICFVTSDDHPEWNNGRRSAIATHPLDNVFTLGLTQPGVFNRADWQNPITNNYGIQLSRKESLRESYRRSYGELIRRLRRTLEGYRNVFTHNPWGEYGHEEHIQVYRVIKELQQDMRFNLWFSNYCSNKSYNLMLECVSGIDSSYVTLKTDEMLGKQLESLYKRNNCWTWYDNYEWFKEEAFLRDSSGETVGPRHGRLFPVNLLIVEAVEGGVQPRGRRCVWLTRAARKMGWDIRGLLGCAPKENLK